jgi:hypothetical protein
MKEINLFLEILVNIVVVLGAIAAAVKLKIYRLYSRRFQSSFSAMHGVVARFDPGAIWSAFPALPHDTTA